MEMKMFCRAKKNWYFHSGWKDSLSNAKREEFFYPFLLIKHEKKANKKLSQLDWQKKEEEKNFKFLTKSNFQ